MTKLRFARLTRPVAIGLLVLTVLLVGYNPRFFLLISVGGLLLIARGVLMLASPDAVLRPLTDAEPNTLNGKLGMQMEHRPAAAMLIVIGAGWVAIPATLAF